MAYQWLAPFPIFSTALSNSDMSTSETSLVFGTKSQDNIGIQLNWTGTPVGTFALQVSMDHLENGQGTVIVAGNFITIPASQFSGTYPVPAGSANQAYVDLNQISAPYFRVVYTAVSGTGTLNGFATGKAV